MAFILSVYTGRILRHRKPRHRPLRDRLLSLPGLKAEVSWSTSDELREYAIGADGIQIGAMLTDQEGLLGGRPTARKKRS